MSKQTEVQEGLVVLPAKTSYFDPGQVNPSLDEMVGRLAKLSAVSDQVELCALGDTAAYVIDDYDAQRKTFSCWPLHRGRNFRAKLSNAAAVTIGDVLGTADDGEIEAGSGFGVVEEGANAGGLPLVRTL